MSSAMQSNHEHAIAGSDHAAPAEAASTHVCGIAPMIAQSQAAFRRDLLELLESRYRWWVAYHGEERIGFAKTETELYQQCFRRGLTDDQFVVRSIQPDAANDGAELLTPFV